MGLLERVKQRADKPAKRSITTLEDYAKAISAFVYNGNTYGLYGNGVQQTLAGQPAESIPNDLTAYAQQAYMSNGPVFALMAVRMMCFSSIRFQWQSINNGRPGKLFGNPELSLLEAPWAGGTTQDLLMKMITDADLAGNAYVTVYEGELVRLRPDWVSIVLEPRMVNGYVMGYKRIGYLYYENGYQGTGSNYIPLRVQDVAHFAPYPDPLATYRGMSWLTPVIRDLTNDKLMQTHQRKFFENGATPNMVISVDAAVSFDDFMKFKGNVQMDHEGVDKAYKTLVMGGGADATVVGANFEQMSFTATQGRGETRLAAAAGVPVTVVGFSEGLQGSSLNAGNFAQARRRLADITMAQLWANASGSLQNILKTPPGSVRLWYDARDVPFLREDARDAADIQMTQINTLSSLLTNGWTPESATTFMQSGDFTDLKHSGLLSVQLQPPGTVATPDTPAKAVPVSDDKAGQ